LNTFHAAGDITISGLMPEKVQLDGRMGPLSRARVVFFALTQSLLGGIKTTHESSICCSRFPGFLP
jgi:hypothetical protein